MHAKVAEDVRKDKWKTFSIDWVTTKLIIRVSRKNLKMKMMNIMKTETLLILRSMKMTMKVISMLFTIRCLTIRKCRSLTNNKKLSVVRHLLRIMASLNKQSFPLKKENLKSCKLLSITHKNVWVNCSRIKVFPKTWKVTYQKCWGPFQASTQAIIVLINVQISLTSNQKTITGHPNKQTCNLVYSWTITWLCLNFTKFSNNSSNSRKWITNKLFMKRCLLSKMKLILHTRFSKTVKCMKNKRFLLYILWDYINNKIWGENMKISKVLYFPLHVKIQCITKPKKIRFILT